MQVKKALYRKNLFKSSGPCHLSKWGTSRIPIHESNVSKTTGTMTYW